MSREQIKEEAQSPVSLLAASGLAATDRALTVLIAASVLLPLAFFVYLLFDSYLSARQAARDKAENLADIIEEHALKTSETNRQLLARVLDTVGEQPDEELKANEAQLNRRFAAFVGDMPQVLGIGVVAADGGVIAGSRTYPLPAGLSIADRQDYQAIRGGVGKYISGILQSKMGHEPMFNVSVARPSRNGHFAGMVMVALRPAYFTDYYATLAAAYPGMVLSLSQQQGAVLARYPSDTANSAALGQSDKAALPQKVGRASRANSQVVGTNGDEHYLTVRQIGDYPVYVSASYATSAWMALWYRYVALIAALTFIPTVGLVLALLAVRRRLHLEAGVWQLRQYESDARTAMESALRQSHRLESLGRLTGGVAHNFNNLLMVVSTTSLVLRKRVTDTALQPNLETLERVVESGRRLTRQLLAFARKQPLRPAILDVEDHMQEFVELLQASVGGGVALNLQIEPGLPPVCVDAAEFELALLNLALNAREAMPDGGELDIAISEVLLPDEHVFAEVGAYLCISIRDTGHGILDEHIERVFEPFFSTRPGNTGMGLSQVYGFCQQVGGVVDIDSEPEVGTQIRLYLPVATAAASAEAAMEGLASVNAGGTALLVEDNPDVAESCATLLAYLGYQVECLATADEALHAIQDHTRHWEVLVSDVMMPGRHDGIDLALAVQQTRPALPVLLVTGYAAKLEQARAAGLQVLAKPFSLGMLAEALDSVLARQDQPAG